MGILLDFTVSFIHAVKDGEDFLSSCVGFGRMLESERIKIKLKLYDCLKNIQPFLFEIGIRLEFLETLRNFNLNEFDKKNLMPELKKNLKGFRFSSLE